MQIPSRAVRAANRCQFQAGVLACNPCTMTDDGDMSAEFGRTRCNAHMILRTTAFNLNVWLTSYAGPPNFARNATCTILRSARFSFGGQPLSNLELCLQQWTDNSFQHSDVACTACVTTTINVQSHTVACFVAPMQVPWVRRAAELGIGRPPSAGVRFQIF